MGMAAVAEGALMGAADTGAVPATVESRMQLPSLTAKDGTEGRRA